jgi:hypothetical protein
MDTFPGLSFPSLVAEIDPLSSLEPSSTRIRPSTSTGRKLCRATLQVESQTGRKLRLLSEKEILAHSTVSLQPIWVRWSLSPTPVVSKEVPNVCMVFVIYYCIPFALKKNNIEKNGLFGC